MGWLVPPRAGGNQRNKKKDAPRANPRKAACKKNRALAGIYQQGLLCQWLLTYRGKTEKIARKATLHAEASVTGKENLRGRKVASATSRPHMKEGIFTVRREDEGTCRIWEKER